MDCRRKRKRGSYCCYDEELRYKIGKYAAENGNIAAVRKFSEGREKPLSESTVRSMKAAYYRESRVAMTAGQQLQSLPHKVRGAKTLLGDLDKDVEVYIEGLRKAGGIVNSRICIAAARGILEALKPSLLPEFGGSLVLDKPWAQSFLRRNGFVKRKGTKAARKVPDNFEDIKEVFTEEVVSKRVEFDIPDDLVLNWDQTGVKLVPVSDWTMESQGSRQVSIVGIDDKREMTVLVTTSLSGTLLPPQLLYAGKTDKCHPKVQFPSDWDVHHSENHWSNQETMLRYVEKIVLPYVSDYRNRTGRKEQRALCIFDVFAAHRTKNFLQKLSSHGIEYVFVPASCTGELQPNDLAVNSLLKCVMREKFTKWYATCVKAMMDKGCSPNEVKVDLRASAVKPIHAAWLIEAYEELSKRRADIRSGYVQAGMVPST